MKKESSTYTTEVKPWLQEYITKLESLRGLLSACAEEAEECMSFAPVQACESMLRDILTSVREKASRSALKFSEENWQSLESFSKAVIPQPEVYRDTLLYPLRRG